MNFNLGRMSYRPCLVASLGSTIHKAKNTSKTISPGLIAQAKITPTEDAPLATFPAFSKANLVTTMVSELCPEHPHVAFNFPLGPYGVVNMGCS